MFNLSQNATTEAATPLTMRLGDSPLWHEKLDEYKQALDGYEVLERERPNDVLAKLGRMRCLHALGEWSLLSDLASEVWAEQLTVGIATADRGTEVAALGAAAAFNQAVHARQADQALQAAARMTSQQRRELKRKKASFAPLHDVLADADVVLIALDARDPSACRSAALEQRLLECGKLPVLALTKCDLVPRACVDGWIAELGARLPTLAFRCPPPELLPPPSAAAGASSKQPVKNYSRAAKLTAGAAAKQDRKAAAPAVSLAARE